MDHGLRAESAAEAAIVANCCAEVGVPHDILRVQVAAGASLQAQARAARYASLGSWAQEHGLRAVATGHHADDQAETLLMRLARGSGVGGLAGVREQRKLVGGVRLIRPLLGCRKADLVALVSETRWRAIDDPSNRDERHDRTLARQLLAEVPWLNPERLARSAEALADAGEVLEALAARERREQVRAQGKALVYSPSLHREMRRRVTACLIREISAGEEVRGPELERLLDRLEVGGSGALAGVLVRVEEQGWRFEPAPPRREKAP